MSGCSHIAFAVVVATMLCGCRSRNASEDHDDTQPRAMRVPHAYSARVQEPVRTKLADRVEDAEGTSPPAPQTAAKPQTTAPLGAATATMTTQPAVRSLGARKPGTEQDPWIRSLVKPWTKPGTLIDDRER